MKGKQNKNIAGLSLKTFLVTSLGILIFAVYITVLMYGENSLTIMNQLKEKKQRLTDEKKILKRQNQVLQKEYFELKQLEPKE
ncbi:MAG: hypothetical protein DRQ78_03505 [Epsilonproteobacteria bacterium]|nr:MAG: hypothetical protein DRQ78_03505 [Campylobacterota bacterium]